MLAGLFSLLYAVVTLLTGTLAGLVNPAISPVMTALLATALLAAVFLKPRGRIGGGGDVACLAFLGIAFLTAYSAACPERSLHLAVQYAAAAAVFYIVLDADREALAPWLAAIATLAAVFGLAMWAMSKTPRVVAPFGLHHYAAGFLLLHLPITWKLARQNPRWFAAAAVQVAAIVGAQSLAAIAALALGGLWTLRRRPVLRIAAAIALFVVAVYVPRTHRLLTRAEDPSLSAENRIRYLQTGIRMIAARPLGWGLGSTPLVSAPYRPQTPDVMPPGEVIPHLHDLPLQLAAETGVLGLLAAAWFLWRARSVEIVPYLLFTLADYQLDIPALLFAAAVIAALNARRDRDVRLIPAVRVGMLIVAALAPISSDCGWTAFSAASLPDLIPVSSAVGAELGSIPLLEHATQLDPYFTLAWYHLGYARSAAGDRTGAVNAYAESLLVLPVTAFAENWDPELYALARRRALERLDAIRPTLALDERTSHRYRELRAFIEANPAAPKGAYRRSYSEITDGGLERSTSLLVFHQEPHVKYTSTISVLLPAPDFYIPPGIGYLRRR